MLALTTILADGITIKIGNDIWTFGFNIIIYVVIAAIVGLIAEAIVGWRLPFGIIGAIIAALVGIWLMTQVIIISGVGDIYLGTNPAVPIFRALIGANADRDVVVLSPSSPYMLSPQASTVPSDRNARVCITPALTATTPVRPFTVAAIERPLLASPRAPLVFAPHVHTVPSFFNATV